jgi:hypothetical protein
VAAGRTTTAYPPIRDDGGANNDGGRPTSPHSRGRRSLAAAADADADDDDDGASGRRSLRAAAEAEAATTAARGRDGLSIIYYINISLFFVVAG